MKKMQKKISRNGQWGGCRILILLLTVAMLFSMVGCIPLEDYDTYDDSTVAGDNEITENIESTGDVTDDTVEVPTDTTKQETEVPSQTSTEESETITPDTEPLTTEADTEKTIETETTPPETEPPETTPPETTPPETEAPKDEPQIPINSTFSIHFIDVGQADAALVECDGHYMLIDGGNKGDSSKIYSTAVLTPDSTAVWKQQTASGWKTRSGYGLNTAVTVSLTGVPADMFAGNAKVNAYYPEFNYSTSDTKSNMLLRASENAGGYSASYTFDTDADSISGGKMHKTPIWFPDGDYSVKYEFYDLWTPAGMLTANNYAVIGIEGSMYDDYYTNRG